MNKAILFVALFLGLAAAFRSYEELQTVLPGMWQGTATSLRGSTRTVQFVFTSDGHYSCHVISSDTAEIDDWSGESCFEEGTDYDSSLKTYEFNVDGSVIEYIDGSITLLDEYGNLMESSVDLVVATELHGNNELMFRVKSPRSQQLRTFFALTKIASEEEIVACEDCAGEGYCYFSTGVCSNDVVYESSIAIGAPEKSSGVCFFTIFIITVILTCLCCCCCKMCRRKCNRNAGHCRSRCAFSCKNNTPQQPHVPVDPYPGFVYMPMFPPQVPSAPMYMPLTEATPVPMPPQYVVVPMMAPEN